MEELNSIIGLVIGVFTLIGILAGVLSVIIKARKGKATPVTEVLDTTTAIIDHSLDMFKKIPDLIVQAEEQYGSGKGLSKLDYVLTKLQLYALQNGVPYVEEELKNYVENVIYTTKTVNVTNKEE